jgi:hypothetical protein
MSCSIFDLSDNTTYTLFYVYLSQRSMSISVLNSSYNKTYRLVNVSSNQSSMPLNVLNSLGDTTHILLSISSVSCSAIITHAKLTMSIPFLPASVRGAASAALTIITDKTQIIFIVKVE